MAGTSNYRRTARFNGLPPHIAPARIIAAADAEAGDHVGRRGRGRRWRHTIGGTWSAPG